jgi:hypothetical protein
MSRKIKNRIDEAKLALVSGKRVGPAAMHVVDKLQGFTPEEQVAGFGLAFLLTCKKVGIYPGNVLSVCSRMLEDYKIAFPEVRALRDYIENEVLHSEG